jgi:hypothetical protein
LPRSCCNFSFDGESDLRLQVQACRTTELKDLLEGETMKKIVGSLMLACILAAPMATFAQDTTKTDMTKQDKAMKKDQAKKDKEAKKAAKKEQKKEDKMKKDDAKKNAQMKPS